MSAKPQEVSITTTNSSSPATKTVEGEEIPVAERRNSWELFLLFLGFGCRAWGGPVAQIAMIKEQLVVKERWISVQQFNRTLAVYQALPGPEATELACYFGLLSKGRPGALLAGLGFVLPGFCLMLLFSWIYVDYGISNEYFRASFYAIQPVTLAMMWRAVPKIGEHAIQDSKHELDYLLTFIAAFSAVQQIAAVPFYLTLAIAIIIPPLARIGRCRELVTAADGSVCCCCACACCCGAPQQQEEEQNKEQELATKVAAPADAKKESGAAAAAAASESKKEDDEDCCPAYDDVVLHGRYTAFGLACAGVFTAVCIIAYVIYGVYAGLPKSPALGFGRLAETSLNGGIFLVGLGGGLTTFGGAFTSIPVVREDSVVIAKWLNSTTFIDALSIGQIIPAPLVMFVVFVGFVANRVPGAILMFLGMFIPAFSFTLIGHEFFELVVRTPFVHASLDGLTASVAGLIAVTAVTFLRRTVQDHYQAILFICALHTLLTVPHRLTALALVMVAICVGQIVFVPSRFSD